MAYRPTDISSHRAQHLTRLIPPVLYARARKRERIEAEFSRVGGRRASRPLLPPSRLDAGLQLRFRTHMQSRKTVAHDSLGAPLLWSAPLARRVLSGLRPCCNMASDRTGQPLLRRVLRRNTRGRVNLTRARRRRMGMSTEVDVDAGGDAFSAHDGRATQARRGRRFFDGRGQWPPPADVCFGV